ncbi:MAG: CsgG/HfaB family protein [Candidatus Marinarcus sp.]|uniref:CsgG/HfaB family protein n=1 Tax=Candidatus Marinarcus sp. TaxID=3100987 RepID=UPI003B004EDE
MEISTFTKNLLICTTTLVLLSGCATNELNPTQYSSNITDKITVPEACKNQYENAFPTVAVMNFTNNSTFGKAEVYTSSTTKRGSALAGIVANGSGIGLGVAKGSKKNTINIKRAVDAKLSETLTPLLESKVSKLGAVKLIARNDLAKINEELKLQDSGLLDPSTTVEFGKISGVKYIVTGSIDNVEINNRSNEGAAIAVNNATSRSNNDTVKIVGLIGRVLTSFTDGLLIKTTTTIKILDVSTGKIIYSQTFIDDVNVGKFANPTYDIYIGGIKAAIINSLEEINGDFTKHFKIKGYITKIKSNGSDEIVQVNIGKKYHVHENQIFNVYSFEENIDPLTGKITCDKIQMPIKLKASQQINDFHSWFSVEEKHADLKLLQLVEEADEEDGLF